MHTCIHVTVEYYCGKSIQDLTHIYIKVVRVVGMLNVVGLLNTNVSLVNTTKKILFNPSMLANYGHSSIVDSPVGGHTKCQWWVLCGPYMYWLI